MLNINKIKNLMKGTGKTQDYFIGELEISKAKFYKRLRASNLEAVHIVKLADILGVSVGYLFDEEHLYRKPNENVLEVNEGMINYKVKSDNFKIENESLKKEVDYLKKINAMLEKEIADLKKINEQK